ncbi:hypothetical protein [Gordonia lacunae]|uniref:Uncharacterized protein n=1 Tax=Gordonia lacunae TaxID=417102 RepID=A0A243QC78_9ACTN|nr:hypothetical protein [Gordonia lacunae]OUC79340.1 hypothetical protein CA982_07680 [Gordonia lacunae]
MEPLHTEQFRLAMDYGQFLLRGNARFDVDEMALLDRAQREQPSANAGTDGLIVVLSPHQNNFDMVIDVQRWERRPPEDRDDWQQVSEDHLTIDEDRTLTLESPTTEPFTYDLDPGDYIAEVSGKDFVVQGWPGSTTPGDSWRIRLWPDTGENLQPPKLWPGSDGQPPEAETTEGPRGTSIVVEDLSDTEFVQPIVDLPVFTPMQMQDPTAQAINWYTGAFYVYTANPHLAERVVNLPAARQHELATWTAQQACVAAGIGDQPWVKTAISLIAQGIRPPDADEHYRSVKAAADPTHPDPQFHYAEAPHNLDRGLTENRHYANTHYLHRAAYAVLSIVIAGSEDPLEAAIGAIHFANLVYGTDMAGLHTQLLQRAD